MRPRVTLLTAIVIVAVLGGPVGTTAAGTADHCGFPYTATDATGTEVTVEDEPERIVTLNPSAAQTMWEIGARDKVVGVSKYATYLEGAETRQNISGGGRTFVSVEKVVGLDPDLVLAPNTISNDTVGKLRESGLTVYKFPFQTSIDDIKQKALRAGRLSGECEGAEDTVARMEAQLSTVREAIEGQDPPRALYVFFGYTGGTGTFAHTVIETAGGTNVAAAANISGYKPVSQEVVVEYDPEWIVVNDGATDVPKTAAYNSTHAVRNDQVVVLQEEYISQPAPRIVRSVVKLAKAFHPEAYERAAQGTPTATATPAETAAATAMPGETPTPTATATSTGAGEFDAETAAAGPESTTTSGGGPGLGVGAPVVALALALAALLVRKRDG